jgi:adenosylcobinamide-GDP ribazoletransferase
VWAYPLVGLLVGLVGGIVDQACLQLGFAKLVAAFWAIAAQVLLTGGLHEDGLADTADGFGGGRDRASKLAIMRDSRIGAFGAIALMLVLGIRAAAIADRSGWSACLALMAAGSSGRAGMVCMLAILPPARRDGMAAELTAPPKTAVIASVAIALGVDLFDVKTAIAAAALTGCVMTWLARNQVGGQSGDILGACEQAIEAVVISAV